jgi:hypothetical protein
MNDETGHWKMVIGPSLGERRNGAPPIKWSWHSVPPVGMPAGPELTPTGTQIAVRCPTNNKRLCIARTSHTSGGFTK